MIEINPPFPKDINKQYNNSKNNKNNTEKCILEKKLKKIFSEIGIIINKRIQEIENKETTPRENCNQEIECIDINNIIKSFNNSFNNDL